MKYPIKQFKSLEIALKEFEPFVRNQGGDHMQSGRPIQRFGGLRPREIWGNWRLCAVANAVYATDRFTFLTDPFDGDGVIWDMQTEHGWPTEHIIVPKVRPGQKRMQAR